MIIWWYEGILTNLKNSWIFMDFSFWGFSKEIVLFWRIFMIFQNAFISSNNVIQGICKCFGSSEKLLEASKPIFKLFWRKNRYFKHILKNTKICKKSHFSQKFKLFENPNMASVSWYMIWNETLRCPRHVLNRYSMSTMILEGF